MFRNQTSYLLEYLKYVFLAKKLDTINGQIYFIIISCHSTAHENFFFLYFLTRTQTQIRENDKEIERCVEY